MWKVELTYRDWIDFDNITKSYYSTKPTCQEAISECITKFNREHLGGQRDIINISAAEEFI